MRSKPDSTIKLILKEVGVSKGAGYAALDIKGNISVEQLIKIAEKRMPSMNSYTLKKAVKEAAGACVPMGVIVEGMHPKEFCKKVEAGDYDAEINSKKTTISEDKKKVLASQLKAMQAKVAPEFDALKKKLEAKAQKEAMKEAQTTAPETPKKK